MTMTPRTTEFGQKVTDKGRVDGPIPLANDGTPKCPRCEEAMKPGKVYAKTIWWVCWNWPKCEGHTTTVRT